MPVGDACRADKKIYSIAIQYVKCKACIHCFVVLKFLVEHSIVCVDK